MTKTIPIPVNPTVPMEPPSPATIKQVLTWGPEQCSSAMQALVSMPGWTLLVAILGTQEIAIAQKALEEGNHKDLAEVAKLQYKITVVRKLLALPEAIINDGKIRSMDEAMQQDNDLDPYEKIKDDISPTG